MSRHTKGPWHAAFHDLTERWSVGGGLIGNVAVIGPEQESAEANARLISAAPELLQTVKLNYQILESMVPMMSTVDIRLGTQIAEMLRTMGMVIDKAERK